MERHRLISNLLDTAYSFTSPIPRNEGWFAASVLYCLRPKPGDEDSDTPLELEHFTSREREDALEQALRWFTSTVDPSAVLHRAVEPRPGP